MLFNFFLIFVFLLNLHLQNRIRSWSFYAHSFCRAFITRFNLCGWPERIKRFLHLPQQTSRRPWHSEVLEQYSGHSARTVKGCAPLPIFTSQQPCPPPLSFALVRSGATARKSYWKTLKALGLQSSVVIVVIARAII